MTDALYESNLLWRLMSESKKENRINLNREDRQFLYIR